MATSSVSDVHPACKCAIALGRAAVNILESLPVGYPACHDKMGEAFDHYDSMRATMAVAAAAGMTAEPCEAAFAHALATHAAASAVTGCVAVVRDQEIAQAGVPPRSELNGLLRRMAR